MFSVKRNHVIITMLVFMIAIAAYMDSQDRQGISSMSEEDNAVVQVGQNTVEEEDLFGDYDVVPEEPFEEEGIADSMSESQDDPFNFVATIAKAEEIPNEQLDENMDLVENIESSHFANIKLDRANYRATQTGNFKSYIKDEGFSQDVRDGYAKKLVILEETIDKEDSIEREMASAGYAESFASMGEGRVEITVGEGDFQDADIAKIEDIAMRITNMQASQIHISPFNK